jgi:hypothetical protein
MGPIRVLHNTRLERLARDKHSSLFGPFLCYKETVVFHTVSGVHNTSFSSELSNGPNKIEWYITLGLKCVQGTNTLVYLAPSYVTKKLKYSVYSL